MNPQTKITAKTALIINTCAFFVISMLDYIGLIIGFFLLIYGLYLTYKVKQEAKTDNIARASQIIGLTGLMFFILVLIFTTLRFFLN